MKNLLEKSELSNWFKRVGFFTSAASPSRGFVHRLIVFLFAFLVLPHGHAAFCSVIPDFDTRINLHGSSLF